MPEMAALYPHFWWIEAIMKHLVHHRANLLSQDALNHGDEEGLKGQTTIVMPGQYFAVLVRFGVSTSAPPQG
jgi:hypothetical protein